MVEVIKTSNGQVIVLRQTEHYTHVHFIPSLQWIIAHA